MRLPPLFLAAIAAQTAPLVAQAWLRSWPRGGRAWALAWCAFLLAMDLVGGWLGSNGRHNLWLYYIFTPVSVALMLWALSCWQLTELWRLTYRIAIVPLLLVWGTLTWAVEDTSTFSRAAEPMAKLVALAAGAATLVLRSYGGHGDLQRQDWFWISGGMSLYFGVSATISPVGAVLASARPDLFALAWNLKVALDIGAFLLIVRGVLCPPAH